MAKVLPESLKPPFEFDYSRGAINESIRKEQEWLDSLGEILQFPMGDGAAMYLIVKRTPLTLQHIAAGDAWMLPEWQLRGLTLREIDHMLAQERAIRALFS